jgi:hypothetical protein
VASVTPTVSTVHVVVIDTRTPIGVAQLVDTMWVNVGKARARCREINTDLAKHPNKVAWLESHKIVDGKLTEIRGMARHGERNGAAKLTEQTVRDARQRHREGESTAKLAAEYGVATRVMSRALYGITWGHVV